MIKTGIQIEFQIDVLEEEIRQLRKFGPPDEGKIMARKIAIWTLQWVVDEDRRVLRPEYAETEVQVHGPTGPREQRV